MKKILRIPVHSIPKQLSLSAQLFFITTAEPSWLWKDHVSPVLVLLTFHCCCIKAQEITYFLIYLNELFKVEADSSPRNQDLGHGEHMVIF